LKRSRSRPARAIGAVVTACVVTGAAPAFGQQAEKPPGPGLIRRMEAEPGFYARVFGTFAVGKGLRFSNPYRLETVIGDDVESVSATATYIDFAGSLLFGSPNGVQQGASIHIGSSVEGVLQPFVTPSYVVAYRADLPFMVYGRVGPAILLSPDANVGGEIAGSFSYFFLSGLGVTSEVVFDLFYGAATLTEQYSVIPVLSFQLGIIADYEFLP
jgi:hypothetical protein